MIKEHNCRVTVFILSVGDPAFPFCEKAVNEQNYKDFRLEIIKNVSPFSKASQMMIEKSTTEFFIQVDEDMILYPEAVEKMVNVIKHTSNDVGMVCFHLWDADRELRIQGIKIYRTENLKKIHWNDLKASEMDILDQFNEKGIKWVLHPDIVGEHGVYYTPDTIYRRYKTMYEKDLAVFNILTDDICRKVEKFKSSGDILNLFAILGAVDGIINSQNFENKEKDYKKYNYEQLKIFEMLFINNINKRSQRYKDGVEYVFKNTPIFYPNLEKLNSTLLESHKLLWEISKSVDNKTTGRANIDLITQLKQKLFEIRTNLSNSKEIFPNSNVENILNLLVGILEKMSSHLKEKNDFKDYVLLIGEFESNFKILDKEFEEILLI